ncbi:MAG: sensor histidine kinase [Bacteroidota bacterium]
MLTETTSDTLRINVLLELTSSYRTINLDSFEIYAKSTIEQSKKYGKHKIAKSYSNLGLSFFYKSKLDSSEYYLNLALNSRENINPITKSQIYNNLALIHYKKLQRDKSITYNLEAIKLQSGNFEELSKSYYNLSCTYIDAGLTEKALEYLKKAYDASKKAGRPDVLNAAAINLASINLDNKNFSEVKYYLNVSDSLYQKNKNPSNGYLNHIFWGFYYDDLKDYINAKERFSKARKIAIEMNNHYFTLESTGLLARNEFKLGKTSNANSLFQAFDNLYVTSPEPILGLDNYHVWADSEASLNNFKKAYGIKNKWVVIKDSIYQKEKRQILIDSEKKYETEKKERAIAEQQVTIKEQELDLAQKQRQIAIWGGLGGILALLLGASFWTGKERQKRKEQEIVSLKSRQEVVRLEALVSGEEKERVRLAQDLHDGINGDLSVIKFKIDGVDKRKLPKATHEGLDQALVMLDNAIDQVRRISHNLAPPSLQNFNLTEAIKQYASKMQSTHSVQIDFETFGDMPHFSSDQETALYRIVQELLNNIIKHAEAKETLIQLNHTEEHTELVIEDDGKGFDTKISKNGIGLQNIASRVAFLKGNLNIESSGEGSTFTITLPKNS